MEDSGPIRACLLIARAPKSPSHARRSFDDPHELQCRGVQDATIGAFASPTPPHPRAPMNMAAVEELLLAEAWNPILAEAQRGKRHAGKSSGASSPINLLSIGRTRWSRTPKTRNPPEELAKLAHVLAKRSFPARSRLSGNSFLKPSQTDSYLDDLGRACNVSRFQSDTSRGSILHHPLRVAFHDLHKRKHSINAGNPCRNPHWMGRCARTKLSTS